MNKEEAIKVIQEEMTSWISENMDSALIFKYISRLEEKLKNSIPKQAILDKIDELKGIKGITETTTNIDLLVRAKQIKLLQEIVKEN